MALSSLSVTPQNNLSWTAQNNLTGSNYNPITNSGRITKQVAYGTSIANAAAGGANEFISYLISLAAAANTTVNLQAVTDILNTANVNLARIKGYEIRLLSTSDDATYGTNCTSIRWGGAAATPQQFNLTTTDAVNTANTAAFTVYKGGTVQYFDQTAGGFTNDNTARSLFFLNLDATNAAKVELSLIGGTT